MAKYIGDGSAFYETADAIRAKTGSSADIVWDNAVGFKNAIAAIPSGGGSAFPVVVGSFTPAAVEKGSAKNITVSYTGSGYPIALFIYPATGANKDNSAIATLAQKNAIIEYMRVKGDFSTTPTYSGSGGENKGSYLCFVKNSDSDPTSAASTVGLDATMFTSSAAGSTAGAAVRVNSSTQFSIMVADTTYGFKDGIEYTYMMLYSA